MTGKEVYNQKIAACIQRLSHCLACDYSCSLEVRGY